MEHFPELAAYAVTPVGDEWRLAGTQVDGDPYESTDLVFHGGPGSTLEMRIFGRDDLARTLTDAGFVNVVERRVERPELGIVWEATPVEFESAGGLVRGMHAGIWLARRPD